MSEALALKYRPVSFQDLVGQRINAVVLNRMVETGKVPHALLFSGPSGVGKTTAARVLANQLHASDIIEVDAASNGGVDQIRKLLDVARYSTGGSHRVLVLDEAHSITRQGFEALLKAVEEPPSSTIYVLVTTDPHKIPETILSRLVEFQFRSVSDADVLDRLTQIAQKESIHVDFALLNHLVRRAAGNVRTAITSLDLVARAGLTNVDDYVRLSGEHDSAPALLSACATGDASVVFSTLDDSLSRTGSPNQVVVQLISCLRDLLVLRSDGSLRVTGEELEIRRKLARNLEAERILVALKILWEVRTKLRTDDARSSLELAVALIMEAFVRGRELVTPQRRPVEHQTPSAAPPVEKKLTLADIQKYGTPALSAPGPVG